MIDLTTLPMCMLPDGAEPCAGFTLAIAKLKRLTATLETVNRVFAETNHDMREMVERLRASQAEVVRLKEEAMAMPAWIDTAKDYSEQLIERHSYIAELQSAYSAVCQERDKTKATLAVRDRDIAEYVRSLEHANQQQDEAETALVASQADVAQLKKEIEDWRGRLATQCGKILALQILSSQPGEVEKLAEEYKGRADDAGRLARMILAKYDAMSGSIS